jgi:hypothetical protein
VVIRGAMMVACPRTQARTVVSKMIVGLGMARRARRVQPNNAQTQRTGLPQHYDVGYIYSSIPLSVSYLSICILFIFTIKLQAKRW